MARKLSPERIKELDTIFLENPRMIGINELLLLGAYYRRKTKIAMHRSPEWEEFRKKAEDCSESIIHRRKHLRNLGQY